MKYISLFESLTNTKVKDCINSENQVIFIVGENEIAQAIGKNGVHAKNMSNILKKPIKVVEFNSDVTEFIKNFIHPIKVKEIQKDNDVISIVGIDTKTKGQIIGRDRVNLENLIRVVKRYFPVSNIKVV